MSNALKFAGIASVGALLAGLSTVAVAAPPGADLAKNKGCMECHAVATEVWGPSFKQVAKYYGPLSNGKALMAQKITKGGAEHWGERSMPSNATRAVTVSDAEAQQMATWILTLK